MPALTLALLGAEGAAAPTFPVLSALILLPALGAALCAVLPKNRPDTVRQVAFLAAAATGVLSLWVMYHFDRSDAGFQFLEQKIWVRDFGIGWHLGVDGISLFLVVLTGLLFPLTIVAVTPEHEPKPYYAWLLLLQAGCMGVFVGLDLFAFFVFFEVVLVPMYFLIAGWGHGDSSKVALKFFLYTMLGSALMLVGILSLVTLHARASGGPVTFDLVTLAENQVLATTTARWIFLSFAAAFAIKVPLFPVHTWLPDAHTEAPTAGSVILAGVMLKLGTYGFIRFGLYLFPEATTYFAPLFLTLGVIGIIYGAIAATMQRDLKRLVAYSSVAHLGFIILGTFALNRQGLSGGILQMVNHGLSTGALFLLVGMIYERRHTRLISELNGLQKAAPILAGIFTVVMLSSIGLPGLNGFVGEYLTLLGAFASARWWGVVATAGVILAALYLLWAYQRVFHGAAQGAANEELAEINWREGLALAPLLAGIVFLGVYPKPMLNRIEPAVERLVAHLDANLGDDFVEVQGPAVERRGAEDLVHLAEEAEASAEAGGGHGDGAAGTEHEDGEG
ncbi:MAG: NADH-quinone oxidoreductase subunit M [Acidimicrobiia bacterium]|nr:NADH-quinone oxidoreductase subunit M [Acidimicrobiia bacterium]